MDGNLECESLLSLSFDRLACRLIDNYYSMQFSPGASSRNKSGGKPPHSKRSNELLTKQPGNRSAELDATLEVVLRL